MLEYYISSTKYSVRPRQTSLHGKVYDVVFRVVTLEGVEKQKKLSGFKNKSEAAAAYAKFVTEKCELVKNNPLKKKKAPVPTVSDLHAEYLVAMRGQNKESTIFEKRLYYNYYVAPTYATASIDTLTKESLYAWQDALWAGRGVKGRFLAYAHLSKIRAYFSAFLKWVEDRYGFKNSFAYVQKPKRRTPKTEMQFWTIEEFQRFIAVVDDPMYKVLFLVLFTTGRRKGEVLALTPADVGSNTISFTKSLSFKTIDGSPWKVTSTKAEKKYSSAICPELRRALDAYTPGTPFFFGGERPISTTTLQRKFENYISLAGVKRIRIHDLRHSFVSRCIHLGANLVVVADLIGDNVEQVTGTYGHLYNSDKQRIIDNFYD